MLNDLQDNISETEILVWRLSAVRHLVEQLEVNVDIVREDLSQLNDKNVNETKSKAEDLLSEAEALIAAAQDLLKQQTHVKPREAATLYENSKARMMEEAQRIMQEMRDKGCTAQRDRVQEDAHTSTNQAVLNLTADSLRVSDSALREIADLLSDAEDRVEMTQSLNQRGRNTITHLEPVQSQLVTEQLRLLPVTDITKDLLKNITDIFLMLEENKKEFENHAAEVDGAKQKLFKMLINIFQMKAKTDIVIKVEEDAEELRRVAADFHQVVHNATISDYLLGVLGIGAYNSIINAIHNAEMAASQSREATEQALKDVKDAGLVNMAKGLKDNSTNLRTEANETLGDLKLQSYTIITLKDGVRKMEKLESLRVGISTASGNLRKDDTGVSIESAKTVASASSFTVSNITQRLKNISQEVEKVTLTKVSMNLDDMLVDSDQTLKNLNKALPVLKDKITLVEALSGKRIPGANLTESIRRIKDVIKDTRNFLKRAPAGSQCKQQRAQHAEYHLYEKHSWLTYTLPQQDLNYRPHFSLDVKTKLSKGLILHVAGRGVIPLLALYMANGKIKMSLGKNRIIDHKQKSNDGDWHRVEFSVEKSSFHLLVDGIRVTDGYLPNNEGSSLDFHNPVYLGGDIKGYTTVGVKLNDANSTVRVSVTPTQSLCDGKFQAITVSRKRDIMKLQVDSMSEQKKVLVASGYTGLDTLYIGGTTKQKGVPVPSVFVGCLRNVKLNRRPVAFENATRVVDPVSINRCPKE
ncbi:hypothetical protein PBY51_024607 [Eleginops maclovinus]|uniref:Laminin G domain-containing protein n=1 Tax=Eleginops maclovinus TaxID=56733 RepID=A0AAN7XWX2_ELEMC|nr:hypothetical protein PBY51_024607 [Eleginops maclovinus]